MINSMLRLKYNISEKCETMYFQKRPCIYVYISVTICMRTKWGQRKMHNLTFHFAILQCEYMADNEIYKPLNIISFKRIYLFWFWNKITFMSDIGIYTIAIPLGPSIPIRAIRSNPNNWYYYDKKHLSFKTEDTTFFHLIVITCAY